eukprot:14878819-Alexandrium_andersonii.AAC.1
MRPSPSGAAPCLCPRGWSCRCAGGASGGTADGRFCRAALRSSRPNSPAPDCRCPARSLFDLGSRVSSARLNRRERMPPPAKTRPDTRSLTDHRFQRAFSSRLAVRG